MLNFMFCIDLSEYHVPVYSLFNTVSVGVLFHGIHIKVRVSRSSNCSNMLATINTQDRFTRHLVSCHLDILLRAITFVSGDKSIYMCKLFPHLW